MEFVLSGPHAGKSIRLGPYHFVEGSIHLSGSDKDLGMLARFLELNWQAYPKGHPALRGKEAEHGQRDLPKGPADGSNHGAAQSERRGTSAGEPDAPDRQQPALPEADGTGSIPSGDGPTPLVNTRLRAAVLNLDQTDPSCWAADGRPALNAVVAAYGAADVTRAAIEAVAPGHRRDPEAADGRL